MSLKYKHELTQAYAAGVLTAKLYNTYSKRRDLPSIFLCMRDFRILRTIYGKYYNMLKLNKHLNPYIIKYEEFNQLGLDQTLHGTFEDFIIGYAYTVKKKRLD